jgi:hypothetical protein
MKSAFGPRAEKITAQSGAKRHPEDAKAASALDGDLGRLKTWAPGGWPFPPQGAVGGRDGGQPVRGSARGRARAAARRAPPGAKAELPARLWRESHGRFARLARTRLCRRIAVLPTSRPQAFARRMNAAWPGS